MFDVAMAPHAASAKPPLYTKMEGYRCSMCQLDEAMYAPVKHGYGGIRGGKATATGEPQQGRARTATPTKVIVLVLPYRGREQNLDTFLRWMLRYAKDRAGERWLVYKVEQNNTLPFNKGWCALYAFIACVERKGRSPCACACACVQTLLLPIRGLTRRLFLSSWGTAHCPLSVATAHSKNTSKSQQCSATILLGMSPLCTTCPPLHVLPLPC